MKCRTCKASGSVRSYTATRGREARAYYCQMREVMDDALQRLYWACRRKASFPGDVPDESTGVVTTDAILRGLHLSGPTLDGPKQPDRPGGSHEHDSRGHQTITPPAEPDSIRSDSATSISQSSLASPSKYSQRPLASPFLPSPSPSELNFSLNTDMPPSTVRLTPQASACRPIHTIARLQPDTDIPTHGNHGVDPYLDLEAFHDATSCTGPTECQTAEVFAGAMHWDSGSTTPPHFLDQSSLPGAVCDSRLAPWTGSLAVTYQSVACSLVGIMDG